MIKRRHPKFQSVVFQEYFSAFVLLMSFWVGCCAANVPAALEKEKSVNIGVLAMRGVEKTIKMWSPTAQYLTDSINGYSFNIVPLNNDTLATAVKAGSIDFVLSNPASYANLEAKQGISRIVTLRNRRMGGAYTKFGALIFTRADRQDIKELSDIGGKTFMAVHPNAFGGWWMALKTFRDHGIDPYEDFKEIIFNGFPQDNIVIAVRDGIADAGTVRTDIIERMAHEGKINLKDFRILNPLATPNFPFAHSTDLYPEWAFATTRHTSEHLAQSVAIALLSLPADHAIPRAAESAGWTVPLDYQTVHTLMKELKVGPYKNSGRFNIKDVYIKYRMWVVVILLLMLAMCVGLFYVYCLNSKLIQSKKTLEKEVLERKQAEIDSRRHALRLAAIYEVTSMLGDINYQEQIHEILKVGCQFLSTEFGRVNKFNLEENTNTVIEVIAPIGCPLKPGFVVPLDKTYCMHVIKSESMVVVDHAGNSQWKNTEAYKLSGFENYIATPIYVNGEKFGTINFSGKSPRKENYSEADKQFVELMGGFTSGALGRQVAEEKINDARIAAIMANKAKSEFLANMSHEIRTPMNAILGYAQILIRDESITDAQRHAVETIGNSSKHLLELINQILDLSKIESGKMTLSESNFDVISMLKELSSLFSFRCVEKNIEWIEDINLASDSFVVLADQGKMRQTLINLLGNAVKFTDSGSVTLQFQQLDDITCQFDIVDTGPGIPDGERDALFTSFSQTKSSINHGGTGLGLAIAKKQLQLMGGEIMLMPFEGNGAHFRFTIPLKEGDEEKINKANEIGNQYRRLELSRKLTALVVDDIEHNRNLLVEQLTSYGFTVSQACDGLKAIESVDTSVPDIIFMDYRMPNMDGIEATEKIKQIYGDRVKIAMVSASVYEHEVDVFSKCGADLVINKPILFTELESKVASIFPDAITLVNVGKPESESNKNTQFSNTKDIPLQVLSDIEEFADIGLVTELENKLEELRSIHGDLANYLFSLTNTMKLQEVSNTARRIIDHGY